MTTTDLNRGGDMTGDRSAADAAHTPGPWTIYENPESHYRLEVVANTKVKRERVVCRVGGPDGEDNARLIAAAPDLLAACLDCMENRGDWGARMNAAIAKATGGTMTATADQASAAHREPND
jgi:hypothetical protein